MGRLHWADCPWLPSEATVLCNRGKEAATPLMPRVHRVAAMLKRWLLGTHQGAVGAEHLGYSLDDSTFRFNRRTSRSQGKLFYRLAQQVVQVSPTAYKDMVGGKTLGAPLPAGSGYCRQLDSSITQNRQPWS